VPIGEPRHRLRWDGDPGVRETERLADPLADELLVALTSRGFKMPVHAAGAVVIVDQSAESVAALDLSAAQ
jgi:hypothetical protein